MSAEKWQVESVAVDPSGYSERLMDLLEEAVEERAAVFDEPAKFRTAVAYVLSKAEALNVEALAAAIAWQRLEKIFQCLERYPGPETVDALRCAGHLNDSTGKMMAEYARRWGWSRQRFYKRVLAVCAFLGIEYQRRKVKRRK